MRLYAFTYMDNDGWQYIICADTEDDALAYLSQKLAKSGQEIMEQERLHNGNSIIYTQYTAWKDSPGATNLPLTMTAYELNYGIMGE